MSGYWRQLRRSGRRNLSVTVAGLRMWRRRLRRTRLRRAGGRLLTRWCV